MNNMNIQMNEILIIYGKDIVLVDLFLNIYSFSNLMHKYSVQYKEIRLDIQL